MINHALYNEFIQSGTLIGLDKERVLVGIGERHWTSRPSSSVEEPCFYFPDFFLTHRTPYFTHKKVMTVSLEELSRLPTVGAAAKPSWINPYETLFRQEFDKLAELFSLGSLQKAVPFVFEETQTKMTPEQLNQSLRSAAEYARNYPVHLYGFWDHNQGILGATPERLFSFQGKNPSRLKTVALAGTRQVSGSALSLLEDPKEQREHQLVIEGIRQALLPLGKVQVGKTEQIDLKHLRHLRTFIEAELHDVADFSQLVEKLHPTPAIGAVPQEEGKKWMRYYQTLINRQRFGAPVGCLQKKGTEADCYVAIRNVQWDASGMRIGAGCGVIAQSEKEKEWLELRHKIQATRSFLAL